MNEKFKHLGGGLVVSVLVVCATWMEVTGNGSFWVWAFAGIAFLTVFD